MKTALKLPVGLALIVLSIAGCDKLPGAGGPGVVVVDLETIAKATGQDTRIEQQMTAARAEANAKLTEVATDLLDVDRPALVGERRIASDHRMLPG